MLTNSHYIYSIEDGVTQDLESITINEEWIIVFYGWAIPAIGVTQNATQLESQKGAGKHSHWWQYKSYLLFRAEIENT